MASRSLRNIETRKKKVRHKMTRVISRNQGNSQAIRRQLKKAANKARGATTSA